MRLEAILDKHSAADVTKTVSMFEVLNHPAYRAIASDDVHFMVGWRDRYPCFFHKESDPSLAIYPNGYYCFGCKAKGDVAAFIMATTDLNFSETKNLILMIKQTQLELPLEEVPDFRKQSAWHTQALATILDEGPKEDRFVWWCKMLKDKPYGKWDIIRNTPEERAAVISRGAGFFSVLEVDRVEVPCWYFGSWYLDLDGDGAADDLAALKQRFDSKFAAWDTGRKGYHVEFPLRGASPYLPIIYGRMTKQLELRSADMNVYSMGRGRLWRIEGLLRTNGRRKTRIL